MFIRNPQTKEVDISLQHQFPRQRIQDTLMLDIHMKNKLYLIREGVKLTGFTLQLFHYLEVGSNSDFSNRENKKSATSHEQ